MVSDKVVSAFPLFLLNGRKFNIIKRWNPVKSMECTWRLCQLDDGNYFFTQGLGTMERHYIFAEGIILGELPTRIREDALSLVPDAHKVKLDYLIDVSSISRTVRDSDLPF